MARWELCLQPLKRIQLELSVTPWVEGRESRSQIYDLDHHLRQRRSNFSRWEGSSTSFQTDNDVFDALLKTGIGDFHALQIPDGDQPSSPPAFPGSPPSSDATLSSPPINPCR